MTDKIGHNFQIEIFPHIIQAKEESFFSDALKRKTLFKVDSQIFLNSLKPHLNHFKSQLQVPGFRKGHAPQDLVYQSLINEKNTLFAVINHSFAETYRQEQSEYLNSTKEEEKKIFLFSYVLEQDILNFFSNPKIFHAIKEKSFFQIPGLRYAISPEGTATFEKLNSKDMPVAYQALKEAKEDYKTLFTSKEETLENLNLIQSSAKNLFSGFESIALSLLDHSFFGKTKKYFHLRETHSKKTFVVPEDVVKKYLKNLDDSLKPNTKIIFKVNSALSFKVRNKQLDLPKGTYELLFIYEGSLSQTEWFEPNSDDHNFNDFAIKLMMFPFSYYASLLSAESFIKDLWKLIPHKFVFNFDTQENVKIEEIPLTLQNVSVLFGLLIYNLNANKLNETASIGKKELAFSYLFTLITSPSLTKNREPQEKTTDPYEFFKNFHLAQEWIQNFLNEEEQIQSIGLLHSLLLLFLMDHLEKDFKIFNSSVSNTTALNQFSQEEVSQI
jgi:hypothetical protein